MSDWAKLISHTVLFGFFSLAVISVQANTARPTPLGSPAPTLQAGAASDLQRATPQGEARTTISLAANDQPPATSNSEGAPAPTVIHPAAANSHLPPFITAPGETDILMNIMVVFIGGLVLSILVLYFRLHALPEQIAHRAGVVQYQVVAVLALISLFTHEHIYWILGLLLALVRFPDFGTPLEDMAGSLAKIAKGEQGSQEEEQHAQPVEVIPPRQRTTMQAPISERKDLSHA